MLAVDAPRKLLEQGYLDLLEFDGICDIEDFFYFVKEHDFLGRVDLGPKLQEAYHDILCQ